MSVKGRAVSVVGQGAILVAIAVAFFLGLLGTVYLSLRSPEVRVPDIVGKDRASAESTISGAGLNFRVRATRPIGNSHPDTVLLQLPGAGEMVKAGQTVAVDISRAAKEGETVTSGEAGATPDKPAANENKAASDNLNENKPKKPKIANKNANGNSNGNANANRAGANGNLNANLRVVNGNIENRGASERSTNRALNSNNTNARANANRGVDSNNRPPPLARPSPANRPSP